MNFPRFDFQPFPLWLKICTALFCTMLVVTLLAVKWDGKYRQLQLSEDLEQQSFLILKLISAGAQESVIMEDTAMLNSLVRETAALDPNLTSLVISNESGESMVQWNRPAFLGTTSTAVFEQPIEFENELFGSVKAQWDPVGLAEKMDERLARGRKTLMFALLCLTSLILVLLHVLVVYPVNKLAGGLRAISGGGSADNLEINSSREMSMLADAVNDLDMAMHESRLLAIELERQANHDALTGLKNRAAFETFLKDRLKKRGPSSSDDVLLYFDLDQFKVINDTCGHAAGDELLVQLVALLSELIGPNDIFARLGGDEFAILMHDTNRFDGQIIAEKIRAATHEFRYVYRERSFVIGASIGMVCITDVNERFKRIMTAADEACYAAKYAGRNRVHVYQENDDELSQRRGEMSWVPKIHAALESSDLVLYGQAIESTNKTSSAVSHVEILVRMLAENGDVIPPGAFLPAAERFGIMPDLDRWVIENTLEWMVSRQNEGQSVPVCAINVSGKSISDAKFRDYLLDTVSHAAVPAENICFEMTETAAVSNLTSTVEFMKIMKNTGCQFALDDFGSGMSSYNYLRNLPVDFIKIDGAFVSPLMSDETCVVMVRAIGEIARVMGIKTIAEFVENDNIRSKLEQLDIDLVQGYGVGKPQELSSFSETTFARAA